MNSNDLESRTRPGKQPDPEAATLRALRTATRDYIVVLGAGLKAQIDEAIEGKPELVYIRAALANATGQRGSGDFGTPIGIEHALSHLLGEPEPTP